MPLSVKWRAAVFEGLGDGDEAARFVEVVDQVSFAGVVAVARFVGQVVAVPAVDVSAAVILGVERALLLLDPRRAGAGSELWSIKFVKERRFK